MMKNYNKPIFVAEIGCNHMGDISFAKELIEIASRNGVDYVKFQKRNSKLLLTEKQYNTPHPNPSFAFGKSYGLQREFLEFSFFSIFSTWNVADLKLVDIMKNENITRITPELITPSLRNEWKNLYDEVREFKEIAKGKKIKTILGVGDLETLRNVAKASLVCMMAGADFIKTSTGKEKINANLNNSLVMIRMIREFYEFSGKKIGFKPAGGISTAKNVLDYLILMYEELGSEWINPNLFRIGASSLLIDIERQLYHYALGRYATSNKMAMS